MKKKESIQKISMHMSEESSAYKHPDRRASFDESDEEETDEFGRLKRRRQRFNTERPDMEDGECDDGDDRRYTSDRARSYYRDRRSVSPRRRRRYHRSSRYSDSDSEDEGRRRRRSSVDYENRNPYAAAARYIDTEFYANKIYVGDLEGVSEDTLEQAFRRYGHIRQLNIVDGKDYAFITYDDKESAYAAIQGMHGARLGQRHIRVNRAKIPERNQVGFGNVPWTDEDGKIAKEEMASYPPSRGVSPLFGSDQPTKTAPPIRRALTSYDDL